MTLPDMSVIDTHLPSNTKIRGYTVEQMLAWGKACAAAERVLKTGEVCGSKPFTTGAMEHLDFAALSCESVANLAGAVGRAVVNDQDPKASRRRGHERLSRSVDDRFDVLGFVEGRKD